MENNLLLVQTVTPSVVYTSDETVKVNIELTNTSTETISGITVTSQYGNLGTISGSVSVNGTENSVDTASGIKIASLGPGETALMSYELAVNNISQKNVSIVTSAENGTCAAAAGATSVVVLSPYARYLDVSSSICTEEIGCVEEVFVEKESIRYSDTCDAVTVSVGLFIGIKYESCKGKNKVAKRHETVSFIVPTEYFNPENLNVSVQKICSSCRDFAQCITVYLKASFMPC